MINEAKDLNIYKGLVTAFCDFVDQQPGTGMGRTYRALMSAGMRCVPKNNRAQDILKFVMKDASAPALIQALMNTTFREMPIPYRPVYRKGNTKLIAFWGRGGKIYDKTKDLLDLDGVGQGQWVDEQGNPVTLIDIE